MALFAGLTTFVCYSPPFPLSEEHLGLNSRNAFTAILDGTFPASAEPLNESALIAIVGYPIQLIIEVLGVKDYDNYLLRLALRSSIASLLLFGLLLKLTKQRLSSAISAMTVSSTFYWITSIQYVPKISAVVLFAGGWTLLNAHKISSLKRSMYSVGLTLGTCGILANMGNALVALAFLPIGVSQLIVVNRIMPRNALRRGLEILRVIAPIWTILFSIGYLRGGSLTKILDYAGSNDLNFVSSTGPVASFLGSGYWAETINLGNQKLPIFGWVPRIDDFTFPIRVLILFVVITVGYRFARGNGNGTVVPSRLPCWGLVFWSLSLIVASTNSSDWPLGQIIDVMPAAIVFREPWTKAMPVYLIALAVFLASVLSSAQYRFAIRNVRIEITTIMKSLVGICLCLFLLTLLQTRSSWQISTREHIGKPTEWMLYDRNTITEYIQSVQHLENIARTGSVCVEFPNGVSDSFRRDFTAFVQIYSRQYVSLPWKLLSGKVAAEATNSSCISSGSARDMAPDYLVLVTPTNLQNKHVRPYEPFESCQQEVIDIQLVIFDVQCIRDSTLSWPVVSSSS